MKTTLKLETTSSLILLCTLFQISHSSNSSSENNNVSNTTHHPHIHASHRDTGGLSSVPHDENEDLDPPIVETSLGTIRGRYFHMPNGDKIASFLGIPYSHPPVHELRFKPPVPIRGWKDKILNATAFGPICYQPGEQKIWDVVYTKSNRAMIRKRKLENYHMSEDCLTINLYVPLAKNHSGGFPIFFYIHGGSYYMNAGRLYPGQVLASTQNIIVATINYRLGPLGFLSTSDEAAPGNYGMLDQVLALDFVYQHAKSFGGDPNRITLVGNSAGAASVMFHMFSELSKGKFVGVTIQSGCSGAPWAIQSSPKRHAESLARKLGCPTFPTTALVDCIRNFSPAMVMKKAVLEDGLSLAYATVVDGKYGGKFLLDHPDNLIKTKTFHAVPVLTGFTRNEVTIWFIKFGPTMSTSDLKSFVHVDVVSLMENLPSITTANKAAMIHSVTVQYLYRTGLSENDTLGKTSSVSDFISDVGLKAPCIKEMSLLAKYNSKPVFLYEFIYSSLDDVKMSRQEWIGAYHESELQFIFGEGYLNYSNHLRCFDDKVMSDLMMEVWGDFVRYGTPTPNPSSESSKLKFNWTNYTEYDQNFAVLGLKPHMDKHFLTDRIAFWNHFFPIFRDWKFSLPESIPYCDSLESHWLFWTLVSTTTILSMFFLVFLLLVLCRHKERQSSQNSQNNHHNNRRHSNNSNNTNPTTLNSTTAPILTKKSIVNN